MRPGVTTINHETNTEETREMTDEEYAELIAFGWTDTPPEEATEE